MKYITILEVDNDECPNIGTITSENTEASFTKAVEEFFDGKLKSFAFLTPDITSLTDCIDAYGIEVELSMVVDTENVTRVVNLSQTIMY